MKKLLPAIALFLLGFQTANAEFKSGNGLVSSWREYSRATAGQPHNANDDGFFTGYVAGVCDAKMHTLFEIPEGATIGQACDVVGQWLDRHPEEWNKPARQLVIKALKEAFPMANGASKKGK
ncbi:MAG: Rap1a/Tai family immunity protein [Chlorobiaceae bacterium]